MYNIKVFRQFLVKDSKKHSNFSCKGGDKSPPCGGVAVPTSFMYTRDKNLMAQPGWFFFSRKGEETQRAGALLYSHAKTEINPLHVEGWLCQLLLCTQGTKT
jgi:hypothetical protein